MAVNVKMIRIVEIKYFFRIVLPENGLYQKEILSGERYASALCYVKS